MTSCPSVIVDIQRLPHAPAELPAYQSANAAGMDLCLAADEIMLTPGVREALPTGFCVAIPVGFEGQIRLRSGFALRTGLMIPNAPGTIDADYRGEVKVIVMNATNETVRISRGERFAQLVIAPVAHAVWNEVPLLNSSDRGSGGFGSTGHE